MVKRGHALHLSVLWPWWLRKSPQKRGDWNQEKIKSSQKSIV
jgi:hypothetical protein